MQEPRRYRPSPGRLIRVRPARLRRRRPNRPASRGQALVELALIAPVLFLLIGGALDLGRLFYARITVSNAAREGAIEASVNPTSFQSNQNCNTTSNRIMCRVLQETSGSFINVTKADVAVSCSPSSCAAVVGNNVTVTVTGHFTLLTGILSPIIGSNLTFSSAANAQIYTPPNLTTVVATPTPTPTATPTPTPTPTPTATPTSTPVGATPTPTPTPVPTVTPTPTPACFAPVANFTYTTPGNKTVTLTDTSTNMGIPGCNSIWSWNFGDGTGSSSNENPTYTYSNASKKTITLQVSNSAGSSTISKEVNP